MPSTKSVTVPTTSPTVLSTSPVRGSRTPTTLPEASSTLPVTASRTPRTSPSDPTTVAPSTRSVTVPMRLPAESTTTPVVSLSVPTMVPSGATTLPVALSRMPRMLPAESTTTLPSTGVARSRGARRRRLAGSGGRGEHPGSPVSPPSQVPAPPSTVSLWSMVLSWMPVATASAVDRLRDLHPLVGQRLGARPVAEQVGADRGVDRSHHVGVERHRQVDRSSAVDRQVDVGGKVQDRDDLLVRQRGDALAGQLLRRSGVRTRRCSCLLLSMNDGCALSP